MRVDLGKGRSAELIDPDDMTHGAKMRIQELLSLYTDDSKHPFIAGSRITEKLIAEVVTSWSLELPVPNGDPALLADVPASAYDALIDATEAHRARLDFNRPGKISSESRTDSEDTSSQDKNPLPEQ
jgi:hypothetical protein